MATHGRGGAFRVLMGSAAETVVRSAIVPILLVRPSKVAGASSELVSPVEVEIHNRALTDDDFEVVLIPAFAVIAQIEGLRRPDESAMAD